MSYRMFASATVGAAAFLAAIPLLGQSLSPAAKPAATNAPTAKSAKPYTPPKMPWGDPDLQGQWPADANIPMQRPLTLAEKGALSPEELAKREEQFRKQAEQDGEEFVPAKGGTTTINPPTYWVEHTKPDAQTSLVVDPPDGRIPALTPEGQQRLKQLRGGLGPGSHFPTTVNSWEDFDDYSRCISRGLLSSMLPTLYNFGNQIVQAPGYVAIRNEMIHETRVIPLDKRPHVGKEIATYMGDPRGHWEGNTLVVETTNLKPQPGVGGGLFTDAAVLTERFKRISQNELSYDLTVNDPKTWTKPWTLHMPYKMDTSYKIYEYACHEGNYMMLDSLSGAREREKNGQTTKVDR